MENYCLNSGSPGSAGLDLLIRLNKAGLSMPDACVLGAFVEVACLDEDQPCARISAPEVAKRAGLSLSAVKRSLVKLQSGGWLVRRQDIKFRGEISWTQVSRDACALLGVAGGAHIDPSMPFPVRAALAGESASVCELVSAAWLGCSVLDSTAENQFRGGEHRLAAVRSALALRAHEAHQAAQDAWERQEQQQALESNGSVVVPCPDGTFVSIDPARLDALAPCPADVGFARDALTSLAATRPDLVTPSSVPKLLAEILYSRTVGFVSAHDYKHAQSVLVRTISKNWGRPRGMWDVWYQAAAAACRCISTAGPISAH